MLDYQRKGYSERGAFMSRMSDLDADTEATLTIRRVPIDSGGYDPGGAYWGTPADLYHVTDGEKDFYARASSVDKVRAMFPRAVWAGATSEVSDEDISDMLTGYVTCALWSSVDDDGEPLDRDHNDSDMTPEALTSMREDCARFARENGPALARCINDGASWEQIGHDFWLSRNGHGCGFFDRDYGTKVDIDALQDAARGFGEVCLYVTDDGKVDC